MVAVAQPVPALAPALDRALSLAQRVDALLGEADRSALETWSRTLSEGAGSPLLLRQMRVAQRDAAEPLLARLTPLLDAAWVELAEIDSQLSARDRAIAMAAWRARVVPWFLRVPLVRRSLDKPLGYPGDYGMVRIIFEEPGDAGDSLGQALTRYTLNVGPCRAHRQRRPWALGHLSEMQARRGRPLRVTSFACGPEHTLQAWASTRPDTRIHLYDAESKALDWCAARFGEISANAGRRLSVDTRLVTAGALVSGDVDVVESSPADVVLVLGLFDYLTEEGIAALVERLGSSLADGGRLLCTNLHRGNPWRAFMEYVGGWQVEHRGLDELGRRVAGARSDLHLVDARLDDTGTNAFVAVERRIGL